MQIQEIAMESRRRKIPITISGGGTGLSGGRVPLEGWIVATDKLKTISDPNPERWNDPDSNQKYHVKLEEINENEALLTVPISMTVSSILNYAREKNWFFPPDTTERSSFMGGNVATNSSGARTFKFGPTRDWVQGIRVVLPDGTIVELNREHNNGSIEKDHIILKVNNNEIRVIRPKYQLPNVSKHVAGPVIHDNSHPIDLFIGTDGIFGIITEITLRLIRPPDSIISIFAFCNSLEQAFKLIKRSQEQRATQKFPIPLSVEYLDERAAKIMKSKDKRIPEGTAAIIILEQDTYSKEDSEKALFFWDDTFEELGIEDTYIAQTHDEIEHQKSLRHCVPEYVLSVFKKYNLAALATDYSVPEEKIKELFHFVINIGKEFERFQSRNNESKDEFGYILWAHAGDSHIHLCLIPHSEEETSFAESLFVKIIKKVVEMGGSVAAEHCLGKKMFEDKPVLYFQYGSEGIDDIRSMKSSFDPEMLLNPKNLIG